MRLIRERKFFGKNKCQYHNVEVANREKEIKEERNVTKING